MQPSLDKKRNTCQRCLRPLRVCICGWITPVTHATEVLLLQHPLEVGHAKNSAGLLHLSLGHCRLLVGEAFDVEVLDGREPKYTVLLYPQSHCQGHETAAALDPAQLADPAQVRLVVLDGTWRKSRKMLHLNPWLQRLPRLSLDQVPASLYSIRKAQEPGQLSTLEAACLALAQLENDAGKFVPLLNAFKGFVLQHANRVDHFKATALQ